MARYQIIVLGKCAPAIAIENLCPMMRRVTTYESIKSDKTKGMMFTRRTQEHDEARKGGHAGIRSSKQ